MGDRVNSLKFGMVQQIKSNDLDKLHPVMVVTEVIINIVKTYKEKCFEVICSFLTKAYQLLSASAMMVLNLSLRSGINAIQ